MAAPRSTRASKKGDPTRLWLDARPGNHQSGRHPILYLVLGYLEAGILLCMLGMDVLMPTAGLNGWSNALALPFTPVGFALVIAFAIVITFIGVLWPMGILSQLAFLFILFSRSLKAPRGATVAEIWTTNLSGYVEPSVETHVSASWDAVGKIGWTPKPRVLIGAYLVAVGLVLLDTSGPWRDQGANFVAVIGVAIVFAVAGLALLVPAARAQHSKAVKQAHNERVNATRRQRAYDLRRSRLTPDEPPAATTITDATGIPSAKANE